MNPLNIIRAFISRARERLDVERRAALWAACAQQMCANSSAGLASMPGSVATSALESATAAHGEDAMRLALSRLFWTRADGGRSLSILAVLGAPLQDGWMERMAAMAHPEGFTRPSSTKTLPRHARDALEVAQLLPETATPLLWLCASMSRTSEHDWAARFEIAKAFLAPASAQEAAACLHLSRQASPSRHGESALFATAPSSTPKTKTSAARDAFNAWIERWIVAQAAAPAQAPSPSAAPRL